MYPIFKTDANRKAIMRNLTLPKRSHSERPYTGNPMPIRHSNAALGAVERLHPYINVRLHPPYRYL